jgi:hypothetical protein
VSNTGVICNFVLSTANVGERDVAQHILTVEAALRSKQSTLFSKVPLVWIDNGYRGERLAGLFSKHGGALWYALRRNRKAASDREAALNLWHRAPCARIENVFGLLDGQSQIEETPARSVWSVRTRVVAKLLAYMVGFVGYAARVASWFRRSA